jgi:hypothetical protein
LFSRSRTVYSSNMVLNGPHCCNEGWVSDGREHGEDCEYGLTTPTEETREERIARLNRESQARACSMLDGRWRMRP